MSHEKSATEKTVAKDAYQIKLDAEHLDSSTNIGQAKEAAQWLHRDVYDLGCPTKSFLNKLNDSLSHPANGLPEISLTETKNGVELDVATNQWDASVTQAGRHQTYVSEESGPLA